MPKIGHPLVRFTIGFPAILAFFIALTLILKGIFLVSSWPSFSLLAPAEILFSLWKGLRFDLSSLAYLLAPALLLYHLQAFLRNRFLHWLLSGYLVFVSVFTLLLWLADIQYFLEAGKHLTYEAFVYLNISMLPIVTGAFMLHPWVALFSLLGCVMAAIGAGVLFNRLIKWSLADLDVRGFKALYLFACLIACIYVGSIAARGGVQTEPINFSNSVISPNPYLNALCLNPVYSVFYTLVHSSQHIQFYDEYSNLQIVKEMLGIEPDSSQTQKYPLVRKSHGIVEGNRKNVVLMILESWSAKDVGSYGAELKLTPAFDSLAKQGMFFSNFFSCGIRTAEGIFSMLNSFPNQPLRPIMHLPVVNQVRWRSISQILAEVGYQNLFICGRALDFDGVREFLNYINFHRIIDIYDYAPTLEPAEDAWQGYHDEDIMRRASKEFSQIKEQPFLGVIYTMNTHPPFVIPDGFPQAVPPTSAQNKFLNSLKYSDYALSVFFEQARKQSYFENTIFILVADHTRTRDNFNLNNQHHIPMLIYSPGFIPPSINSVVGSQVDLLPTILGLLNLQTNHSSFGQDLTKLEPGNGFAVSIAGNEARWHDATHLLNDGLLNMPPLFFDTVSDPECSVNIFDLESEEAIRYQVKLRSYISLSQTLLYQNRVCP